MTVVGAAAVDAATGGVLHVGARDVVTPLARERARELGVEIVVGSPVRATPPPPAPTPQPAAPTPAPPRALAPPAPEPPAAPDAAVITAELFRKLGPPAPPMSPPSGALFRRNARLSTPAPAGTGRVVVVGAGQVGTIAALRLADADVFDEVVLVDVDQGRAAGVALDLTHTAALSGFGTRVRGVGSVEEAGPADYVIITAGRPRQPGMSRSDLISTNAAVVGDIAKRVAATAPDAVIVVVTNPLDEMTQHAWRVSGFPAHRVLGMAGVLDTARFQALAGAAVGMRADRVSAWALGSHGDEMVIPLSQARAAGTELAGPAVEAAVDRARNSGAEVVGLLRTGSAFLAPGTSAARMVLAMAADRGEVMPAAVLADGTYGIRDVYVGLPARLGRTGVREIVELDLSPAELAALREAAERIRIRVADLEAVPA
ncbi:malate dehydrogenase (NAD) [Pseudonocardia thermophila]|jgi:Malate/lactate dehydrogenases|uniref:Malate dehydrogenase (NAD) n=1 Tax=Pseudonocardia thermophila TaxID=1848 RepID=A0A1M6ZZM8_PSETH|nr:malate dehydrogenase [Pseudonocardia thermophila]SHL35988.1 malate dehydrogenase (NAD) [Pseudonocardia thermophila]